MATYTFVIRSADRVYGDTNDFRVQLPYQPELAKHDYWRVSVQRAIFPKSDAYFVQYDEQNDDFKTPTTSMVYTHEFMELRIDFGSACKGHDTQTKGGRMVHFVTSDEMIPLGIYQSGPNHAVDYEIARPSLGELRVQVFNKDGVLAGMMLSSAFPNFADGPPTAGALSSSESDLPEWTMILHASPINKNIYEE